MTKLRTLLSLSLVATALPFLCAFESAPTQVFIVSVSPQYSGHEEITRQALNNTIQRIGAFERSGLTKTTDFVADLGPTPMGLYGALSKNMIIHGNFATDFPSQTSVMDLGKFWGISSMSHFENPKNQVFHFLRNYKDNVTVASARETCMQARENIKVTTREAVRLWEAGQKSKALFLIGHATHTIQDSFSSAHAQRDSANNNYNLRDVCFYGNEMGKKINDPSGRAQPTCYHKSQDSMDVIWNMSAQAVKMTQLEWPNEKSIQCDKKAGYPQTEEQKQACLKNEARLARLATEKYLYIVLAHLNSPSPKPLADFVSSLDSRLFDGPVGNDELDRKMSKGIMRCEGLSNQQVAGWDPNNP